MVCGITIGRYSFIGAGAVVSKEVPDYALMIGVPARQKGWMSRLKCNTLFQLALLTSVFTY